MLKTTLSLPVVKLMCAAVLFASLSILPVIQASAQDNTKLQVTDCIKCHTKEPQWIESNGGKHKTEITCLDCHVEHLPDGTDRIPQCSRCHEGTAHFQLENCLGCHTNPHMPIASLKLPENAKAECGTCHEQEVKWIDENPSKHAEHSCTFCHDVHGRIPDCSECHEPHKDGQKTADCLTCHNPHMPLKIVPPEDTPVAFCGACHSDVAESLSKTTTKHGQLSCVYCHKGTHPTVPACQDCHGLPHGEAIHKSFPQCENCHMDPHMLVK